MQNYNFSEKILHRICLGNKFIKRSLFELEKILFYRPEENYLKDKHVFITGLPRAGTTALLENIYETGNFASLIYEDMPFLLSPNLLSKIYKPKNFSKIERAHGDGIFYNLSSPEALDEPFFSIFKDSEIEIEFKKYVWLILKEKNQDIYLKITLTIKELKS